MEISSESSYDNKVGFYRQDRPVVRIVLSSGSSYRQDRPLTMRCQSLRPQTMRSNVVVRIVLSSGSSCDDEVLESASLDDEVSESNNKVEFL